jgi:hydroxypyruvate isomerase
MAEPFSRSQPAALDRRALLRRAAVAGAAALAPTVAPAHAAEAALRGHIKHSVVQWCFQLFGEKWDADTACQVARELGCVSLELVAPEDWPTLKKHGLICAISPNGMPGAPFMKGFNNPAYHEEVITRTKKAIEQTADAGFPSVIAFTGFQYRDAEDPKSPVLARNEMFDSSVKGLKEVVGLAEKRGVTICIEHLNTRDKSHPMKGHPGYAGDDLEFVASIVRKVGSPRLKVLFDIYHVQVMHGDLIRRIEENREIIGHVHTAGCPGRGELDDTQEIRYPAVMRKLVEIKYGGYVGHEFIPTRNPREGLREAIRLCDV